MAGELKALIKVTALVTASMAYARFASSSISPGKLRLLSLLPVLLLLPTLPFSFSSVHLRGISAFFLAWLAVFKLLLLSIDLGPLSPSLPFLSFLSTASLPIKPTQYSSPTNPPSSLLFPSFLKSLLLALIIPLYRFKDQIHPYLLLSLYCVHIYLALELVLASAAALARALLGCNLEPQFNAPYLSTSLQDFWGRRWNLMVTRILRPSVYGPVKDKFGTAAGILATFLVSGIMHEVMYYYVTLAGPTGEVTCFFVLHGVSTVGEVWVKRRTRWRPPAGLSVVVTVGIVAGTAFWLFFPQILRSGVDRKVVEESAAMMGILEEGGRAVCRQFGLVANRSHPAVW